MPYTPDPTFATRQIMNRLLADSVLAALVGTVLNRPPKREGRFDTPSAFDLDLRIKPTVYVAESTRQPGPNVRATPTSITDRIRIYFIGPSDEERKDILRRAKMRVRRLLTRANPDTPVLPTGDHDPWYYRNEDGRIMFSRKEVVDAGFYTSEILIGESAAEGFMDFMFDGQTA